MESKPVATNQNTELEKAKLLKKKTPEELAALASKKVFSTESVEEPVPVTRRPSELSMGSLNNQLKEVQMVKAFNSAENHAYKTANDGEKKDKK